MVEAVLVAIETFFEWVPGETSVCLNSLVSFCDYSNIPILGYHVSLVYILVEGIY